MVLRERLQWFVSMRALVFSAFCFFLNNNPAYCSPKPDGNNEKSITQYSHTVWQTENGLPQNSVSCIIQSHDGYLWLGTLEGLVRFDGVRFTVYDQSNVSAFNSNRILSLLEDHTGRIWIGTEGGGITVMEKGNFKSYAKEDGLFSNTVKSICEDREGTIWISAGSHINIFRDGELSKFIAGDSIRKTMDGPVCLDSLGRVWITGDSGIYCYNGGFVQSIRKKDGLESYAVASMITARDGSLWIGTNKGLSHYKNGRCSNYTPDDGLSNNYVWSLHESRDSSILIGTQGGGLNHLKNGKLTLYSINEGLSNKVVWSVFEDREGIIWIGTNGGGLNRLKNALFTTYSTIQGLSNDFVWSVCEDRKGSFWFGTYDGLSRLKDGIITRYTAKDGLYSDFVWSVYPDRDGNMWVGTGNGLNIIEDGVIRKFRMKKDTSQPTVRSILQDHEGTIWVGTNSGLTSYRCSMALYNNTSTISYTKKDSFAENVVMSLCEGRNGNLWIGTSNGLRKLHDGVLDSINRDDGLSSEFIRTMYEDTHGNLWIGTQGGGLNLYRDGAFTIFSQTKGLFSNTISQILEDDNDNLWMSSNKGIFSVSIKDLLRYASKEIDTIQSFAYGTADGMISQECNGSSQPAGWKSNDGRLWFPTIKGVVAIDPKQSRGKGIPPSVIIEKAIFNKQLYGEVSNLQIPPGDGEIEIQYTGLNFTAPEKIRFKYKLEGYDRDWVEVGTRRTAFYTNLSPGQYTFRVTACNSNGLWNDSGSLIIFILKPHFYQQTWFYILCGLSILGIGIGLYGVRIRQLQINEKKLKQTVDERTQSIKEEKENAERAREEAERQQKIAEEANKVKSELLHIAAHDMKSPLISIRMFSQIIANEVTKESTANQFASDIQDNSQRMLDLINELLDASVIESGKFQIQKTHVDLFRVAETCIFNSRRNADRKEQKIILNGESGCIAEVDESRIRQVMDNLMSNAIKYSPAGGKIWISTRRENDTIIFEVKDEGPGLTEDDKMKVFGKFQRLSARPTAGEPSTGLGLAIVKQLVELQGGTVRVESEIGKGSVFIVEFPAHK